MSNPFVHLHTHSEYSLLDGLGRIKDLVAEAKRLGQPALALTDHGVMHGAVEFFRAARSAGVQPIIGVEAYQTVWGRPMQGRDPRLDKENYHLLLLARNMTGYRNLLKISSYSHLDGYYYKPRVDHEFLAQHAAGLIATTGCLGAEIPQLISQGKEEEAYQRLGWYVDVFGKDHFFIELQEHNIPELREVNKVLVPWAKKFGLGLVVTNDVHYVRQEDASPHEVLLCVQTGTKLSDEKRMRMSDGSYYLKSRTELEEVFRPLLDLPASAFDNTLVIAEMCQEVDLEDPNYHLPDIEIPEGFTYETYLRHLTEEGLRRRYGERADDPEVQERKERELRIIHEMGFDVYFLIVADLCNYARSKGIWWNVRGSGAGSLVAYCIGITNLDPLKNNLIFERFLNPGRVTMPDFDLDFPDDQREEMIRYTIHKYGSDQVAQIVTFGRMKARAAVRDVGRVKDIPLADVDRIAKLIPAIPGKPVTIKDVLTPEHEFYNPELAELYEKQAWVRDLLDTAMQLEGVARHSGIHAAAVIVADRELIHYTPLMRGTKGAITEAITQYEFPILESIGLLKVDFLGLSTLTVLREACRLIRERHGVSLGLDNIPFEGEAARPAFELLSSGEVSGVFQVESQGMRRVLTEMRPSAFEHIVATISLYRPGPLEYIPQFIRRMHGEEEVEFKHPALAPILAETYGITVYQEQIIQILSQLAGYTPGDADLVRRAISKKKKSEIDKHRQIFIQGCTERGIPAETAASIYDDIEYFARYGFNKCLPGDVEIVDGATGKLIRIQDLAEGRAVLESTLACDTETFKLRTAPVGGVHANGVKPVFRLTTRLGRQIEATANHPFYTLEGWRLLAQLRPGDLIATPRQIPVEGQDVWPEHRLIVLGHLLAEGNLCHPHSVYFYSQDREQVTDYVRAAEQFDNVACTVADHRGTWSVYARRVQRNRESALVAWIKELGLWGCRAQDKFIPDPVFTLRNDQIALLLARMWEGDGHINVKGRSLFYATASRRMARQMQHLLLRLGIIASLRTVVFPYKDGRTGYQLFVTGQENFLRFARQIGVHFISPERRDALAVLAQSGPSQSSVYDVIPLAVKERIRAAKERHGITWETLRAETGVASREFYPTNNPKKNGFTRETIRRLAESDLYWDTVETIEYVGEKETYDLTVPGLHNFLANDILVHNSHAADYAVITVQTAYLKAKYPVEYMAALLLVERDKTEKVVNFLHECRRMGIRVLPPDVNYSGLDFEIQDVPEEANLPPLAKDPSLAYDFPVPEGAAIRFGMAAVKNVGEGPVQVILQARREGGPFTSLEDFCDRVDLRQVNRRALECLIKVGALDRFGERNQLLEAIDQMMARSAATHSARDSGQLSMFDLMGGAGEPEALPIRLPDVKPATGRERLGWEKELLGMFASSHPLQQIKVDLDRFVTCSCAELGEQHDGQPVTVAGLIADIRVTTTKKGDRMAFIQLEDLQGHCEVVLFPRTYAEVKDLLELDRVVLVKGKAQTRGNRTSVLADTLQTAVQFGVEVPGEDPAYQQRLLDAPRINGVPVETAEEPDRDEFVREAATPYSVGPRLPEPTPRGLDALDADEPFYEENPFADEMPDWMLAEIAEDAEKEPEGPEEETPHAADVAQTAAPATPEPTSSPAGSAPGPSETPSPAEPAPRPDVPPAASAAPAQTPREPRPGHRRNGHSRGQGRLLRITFTRTGHLDRDKYRLKEIVNTVRDPRGRDRFEIVLRSEGRSHALFFPNDYCTITPRLLEELRTHFRVDVQVDETD